MIQQKGDIFSVESDAICVTTNGIVKPNGELVMGAGIAKEFANRYPTLPRHLGKKVKEEGNNCYLLLPKGGKPIISFPTKHDWRDNSDITLIVQSALQLVQIAKEEGFEKVTLTRPGCGLGGLEWEGFVEPILRRILDDRFIVVTK